MADPRKRRRFAFSLRTLFILVTASICWLGWNIHLVNKRKQIAHYILTDIDRQAIAYGSPLRPWLDIPIGWKLLGVRRVRRIELGANIYRDDYEHIKEAFPE